MFDTIIQHNELGGLIRLCCHENGMMVEFDDDYYKNTLLDHEKAIILKIDAFYNTIDMAKPPPSIDCLIVVKCDDGTYSFYLIELRDVTGTSLIHPRVMSPKFETVIEDFFKIRFPNVFLNPDFIVKKINMWVVSDALGTKNLTEEEYRKKIKGTVIEQYLSIKPFRIRDKIVQIEVVSPILTTPIPIIRAC